jgi:PAS domain S-box-containing protein
MSIPGKHTLHLFLPFLAIFVSPIYSREVLEMRDEMGSYAPNRNLEVYEDRSGSAGISEIEALSDEKWTPHRSARAPIYGFSRSAFWFRFTLAHFFPTDRVFFEIDSPMCDSIRLYTIGPDGDRIENRAGLLEKKTDIAISHHNPLFAFFALKSSPTTLYIRIRSETSIQLSGRLMSETAIINTIYRDHLYYGIFFGILFILIFYNAFLYYSLKVDDGSHYVILIGSFTLFHFCDLGFASDLFWKELPYLSRHCLAVTGSFSIFTSLLFAKRFLRLSENYRRLDGLVRFMMLLLIPIGILSLTAYISYAQFIIIITTLLYGPVVIAIIFYVLRKGDRPARNTLIGIVCLVIGILPYLLTPLKLFPFFELARHSMVIGTGLMAIFISLAVEDRIRLIKEIQRKELETEIRNRTSALTKSEEKYRVLTERANDGITILQNHRIRFINRRLAEISGYAAEEVLGTGWTKYLFPSDHTIIQEVYKKWMVGESIEKEQEFSLIKKDGSSIRVMISGNPIDFEGGVAMLVFIRDIEDRQRHQMLREDMERLIRHDLKNPLNGILGFSEMLSSDQDLKKETREMIRMIHTNGLQILYMIDHTMDFFNMIEGNYSPKPEAVDMLSVMQKTEREMRQIALQKSVRIDILLDHGMPGVNDSFFLYGEKYHLEALVANLVRNAVEAAPEKTRVTIRLSKRNRVNLIDIHNYGTIPESIRDKFFERNTTANKPGGNGYGTYSASLIARSHGGNITFTTSDDEGTHLYVTLP